MLRCPIPDVCIDERRLPLFIARATLRDLIAELEARTTGDLEQTLMRYVHLYNTQLPQSALRSRTPMQAMKDWHKSHPHLFVKSPRNHPGRDT